jgi:hypothetical protein
MNCFRSGLHAIAAECPRADFSFRDLGSSGLTTPLATKEGASVPAPAMNGIVTVEVYAQDGPDAAARR